MRMEHYEHHVFINFNLALNYQIPIPPCQAHLDVISANRPQAKTTCSTYIYYLSYRDILLLDRHKTPHFCLYRSMLVTAGEKQGLFQLYFFPVEPQANRSAASCCPSMKILSRTALLFPSKHVSSYSANANCQLQFQL